MVKFENGEFEIAITTYKRAKYIIAWLEKCYISCVDRNISISVYDSSPDLETQMAIEDFNKDKSRIVNYHRVNENTNIGYKPMIPILESTSKYLWVSGDSRFHDFEELDIKVFPYIKEHSVDYICFNIEGNYDLPDTVYSNDGQMLHDIFIPSTCIGLSIYRTEMFDSIKNDEHLLKTLDELFKDNFGFGWLGYFYNIYGGRNYNALLVNIKIYPVLDIKKKQSWVVRFYGCWMEDLCAIIDNIPDTYENKDDIPMNTWKTMKLDDFSYCYMARKYGDLNRKKYNELYKQGLINRILEKPQKIKIVAYAPMIFVEGLNVLYRFLCFINSRRYNK